MASVIVFRGNHAFQHGERVWDCLAVTVTEVIKAVLNGVKPIQNGTYSYGLVTEVNLAIWGKGSLFTTD